MCQFKSAIVLKNRVFVPDYDSHSDMLKELHIEDDYMHASTQFVRVELSPPDGNRMSDIDGWKLKVDQDITPDWWDEKADLPRIKEAIKDWRVARTLKGGEHEVKDGVWFATDSATVRATGSATVEATDSATVEAYDSATVIVSAKYSENVKVECCGEAVCVDRRNHSIKSQVSWIQGGNEKTVKASAERSVP